MEDDTDGSILLILLIVLVSAFRMILMATVDPLREALTTVENFPYPSTDWGESSASDGAIVRGVVATLLSISLGLCVDDVRVKDNKG